MKIKISDIKIGKRIRMDMGNISELAENIEEEGLLTPIIVRENEGGTYKLLAGYRRLRAHNELKLSTIEAIIKNPKVKKYGV